MGQPSFPNLVLDLPHDAAMGSDSAGSPGSDSLSIRNFNQINCESCHLHTEGWKYPSKRILPYKLEPVLGGSDPEEVAFASTLYNRALH